MHGVILNVFMILAFNGVAVLSLSMDGKEFVVSCPWVQHHNIKCWACMTTKEVKVSVKIRNSVNNSTGLVLAKKLLVIVERKRPSYYLMEKGEEMVRSSATFVVKIFLSDKPFRLMVVSHDMDNRPVLDAFVVPPKSSCVHTYHAMTANGNPFLVIFAFDYTETHVSVTFPKVKDGESSFSQPCFASECASGKTVHIQLSIYRAWFFSVNDLDVHLRNTWIQADRPIHVISGNLNGWAGIDKKSDPDVAVTSLIPSKQWGKVYVVPPNDDNDIKSIFAFAMKETPLTISFLEINEGANRHTSYVINTLQGATYFYGSYAFPMVVMSEVPFGLYQIRDARMVGRGMCILEVVPMEMWKSMFIYIPQKNSEDGFTFRFYLLTQANRDDVVFASEMKSGVDVVWRNFTGTFGKDTFSLAEIPHTPESSLTIYTKSNEARLILYVYMEKSKSITVFPYDHWYSEIHQESCVVSTDSIMPNDGIDNDCDDKIDEELENGIDDDGDGRVDEDINEVYSDGEWSQWKFQCDHPCNEMSNLSVRVRTCQNRSIDGRDCEGNMTVQCNEEECPNNCENTECFCDAGCMSCEKSTFQCDDPGCKPGFLDTPMCLTPCPNGWTGIGCATELELKSQKYTANKMLMTWIAIGSSAVSLVIGVCIGIAISRSRCRRRNRPPDVDEDESWEEDDGSEGLSDSLNEPSLSEERAEPPFAEPPVAAEPPVENKNKNWFTRRLNKMFRRKEKKVKVDGE